MEMPLYADRSAMEKDICNGFLDNCNLASRGALRFKVRHFFDHSAWNLVIGDSKTVYLLDIPKADYVSYPSTGSWQAQVQPGTHKAVPPPSSWDAWEVSSLYSRFLETYCSEVGFNFKEEDHRLIDCFTRANIKRSQDTSRKDKFH